MVSLLERYILREFLTSFSIAIAGITAILFIGTSFKILSSVPGLDLVFLLEVIPLILPYALVHAMPLAALIGAVTAHCRMRADNEVMAMKLTGTRLRRLVLPTIFLGLVLSFASLMTNNHLAPYCRGKLKSVTRNTVTRILSSFSESRNTFQHENYKFHWQRVSDGRLEDVLVYKAPRRDEDERPTEPPVLVHAKYGRFRLDPHDNLIKFEVEGILADYDHLPTGDPWHPPTKDANGSAAGKPDDSDPFGGDLKVTGSARSTAITIDLDSLGNSVDKRVKAKDRDIDDLFALYARDLAQDRVSRPVISLEVHRRISAALANLTLSLLGAAVGFWFRGTNRILAYLIAVAIGVAGYYPITQVGLQLAEQGRIPAVVGSQLGNVALLVVSAVFLRRGLR